MTKIQVDFGGCAASSLLEAQVSRNGVYPEIAMLVAANRDEAMDFGVSQCWTNEEMAVFTLAGGSRHEDQCSSSAQSAGARLKWGPQKESKQVGSRLR